jgi:hypothetical protein
MPWQSVGLLEDRDLRAVFAYLHSIKPIDNAVPAPIPPAPSPAAGSATSPGPGAAPPKAR